LGSGLIVWSRIENVTEVVVGPMIGLAGAATGFYFAQAPREYRRDE
jgi:hypothetical protein